MALERIAETAAPETIGALRDVKAKPRLTRRLYACSSRMDAAVQKEKTVFNIQRILKTVCHRGQIKRTPSDYELDGSAIPAGMEASLP